MLQEGWCKTGFKSLPTLLFDGRVFCQMHRDEVMSRALLFGVLHSQQLSGKHHGVGTAGFVGFPGYKGGIGNW